jgi:hypothetical protein
MQGGFHIEQALADLSGRSDAWRFIRHFAAEWAIPIVDEDGSTQAELDDAERRLGVRLPLAVREAYQLLGRRKDLTSVNGTLWGPEKLDYDRENQILVFRAAHQGVAFFGVSLTDQADDDPPVLYYATLMDRESEEWEPFLDRFSLACVDMVLWEAVEAGPLSDGRDHEPGATPSLTQGLTRLSFPRYRPNFDTAVWYVSDDLILRDIDSDWLAICARTEPALDRFRHDHPGRWVNEYSRHRNQ